MFGEIDAFYFYPRPPGGGRPAEEREAYEALVHISIHALRVEGDTQTSTISATSLEFLSTPSGWRATRSRAPDCDYDNHFYPRPPGGGRQQGLAGFRWGRRISIHALRVEGDSKAPEFCIRIIISIHALRVEGDGRRLRACRCAGHFYPRPPGGGRPLLLCWRMAKRYFYPRPPGGGRRCSFWG